MPDILEKTKEEFFSSKMEILRECAETCYEEIKKIPCMSCPYKPEASMFTMVINKRSRIPTLFVRSSEPSVVVLFGGVGEVRAIGS